MNKLGFSVLIENYRPERKDWKLDLRVNEHTELPYKKGVYYPSTEKEKISVGAERQRRYRAMKRWRADPT